MKSKMSVVSLVLAAVFLVGCATPGTTTGEMEIRSGVIQSITPTQIESSHHQGIGAILGGLGGAAVGSLFGNGSGRDVMMVAGAVGGGFAGNAVQKNYDQPIAGQQILVRLNNGVLVTVIQPVNAQLAPDMKVYVQGAGTEAHVVPQY
ncbi:glycine zipper 2TM domain-containing protein [Aestuariirhabdus litorea]|uniref:Glycine zipper 2TM domain-containing protein n=1 Tax=Aestuariirhabdus litorea TaxID=2528527 RepID=A0A3P3VTT9_9GAMM|nr:glycine zipper 2TM domain-containing protein [Aestuariirhabdus litorea]RRJ85388.1 glycine zipper 2TM domain-containing protein [Aestuariirhabdus litorea]RWW96804.1 glycine zipper 2TM domain-containing protein [Endozoicomonadaceae bacterium GTF-13]